MASSSQPIIKASVILDSTKDWDEWIFLVRKRAEVLKIWELVNPELSAFPVQPIRPPLPSPSVVNDTALLFSDLNTKEQEFLKFLLMEYKSTLSTYEQQTSALGDLTNFILSSISRNCLTFILDCQNAYEMLVALQKRFAPTDRAREIEISRQYQALKRPPKLQNIDRWLQQWERIYKDASRIALPEVQQSRPLYDFLLAIKPFDSGFASTHEVLLMQRIKEGLIIPSIYDLIEDFRNHTRLSQAATLKSYSAFATFQDNSTSNNNSKPKRNCVCGESHFFKECLYLNEHLRPPTWTPDTCIQQQIDEKLKVNERLRQAVQRACKLNGKNQDSIQKNEKTENKNILLGSFACYSSHAAETLQQYKLQDSWILDSGSDSHVCNDPSRIMNVQPASTTDFLAAGKTTYKIEGYGTCIITVNTPNGKGILTLINVALVPGFLTNLVALSRFIDKDIHWDTEGERLHSKGKTFCFITRFDSHWVLETDQHSKTGLAMATHKSQQALPAIKKSATQWHQVLGHPSYEVIKHIQNNTKGAIIDNSSDLTTSCESCSLSKAHQIISRRHIREDLESQPLERIAFDLIQMTRAYNNDQWVSHFYCYQSAMNFIFTHAKKSDIVNIIIQLVNTVERRFSRQIRFFRTDGETALGNNFDEFVASKGIIVERSAPYTPAQNGAAERSGGVLIMKARAMRVQSCLPSNLWPEFMIAAGYILNRTPTRRLAWKTPFEIITGNKPSLAHMRIYGCRAYPLRHQIPRTEKLEPRAHIGYLVGYDSTNIFRIWIPSLKRVIRTRDVTFNENKFYNPTDIDLGMILQEDIQDTLSILDPDLPISSRINLEFLDDFVFDYSSTPQEKSAQQVYVHLPSPSPSQATQSTIVVAEPDNQQMHIDLSSNISSDISIEETAIHESDISSIISTNNILPDGVQRTRRQAYATALSNVDNLQGFYKAFAVALEIKPKLQDYKFHRDKVPVEPRTWKQMLSHPFTLQFQQAAQLEYNSLQSRETFKTVSRSLSSLQSQQRVLPLLWVFKYKFNTDGFITKFKARLCVRGDLQVTDRDVYTATLAVRTFRALMAIAAAFDLECQQYDAVNAFVNSKLDEKIFCECPDGFQQNGKCLQLLRALYGLKQSPLLWFQELTKTLESLGLYPVPGVNCLYTNDWLLIFFYVDDIVAIYNASNIDKFIIFESNLLSRYEMHRLGDLEWFLGIRVQRDRSKRILSLCQDSYITKIVSKFNLEFKRIAKSPLPDDDLIPYEGKATAQEIFAYQQRLGSINFAAITTRPDISFAVSRLSEYLKNPSPIHLANANRVISYLDNTKMLAIQYNGTSNTDRQIFLCSADASFADNVLTRKSSQGYVFSLYGGPIDWRSSKQKSVTTSSTEAELLSLSYAAKEVIWWKRFFHAVQFNTEQATIIHCDNLQTVRLLTQEIPKLDTKLRHVDIHQHWLRQEVMRKALSVIWIPTREMPADGLTKALPRQRHEQFIEHLNLINITTSLDSPAFSVSNSTLKSEGVCQP